MKRKTTFLVSFLLVLCISSMVFVPAYDSVMIVDPNAIKDFTPAIDGNEWLEGWDYRKKGLITGSAGAGTFYQIQIIVSYDSDMQIDFDDLRVTDSGGKTQLYYWIETYVASGYAVIWVNVSANLDSNQYIYMYYGNSTVSTTSNGHATFQEFYDKDSIAGWSTSGGLTVTTSGDFLRFYNPVAASVGFAQRTDITTSADFQYMAQYKTVSLGANDVGTTILMDASTSHRLSQSMTPYANIQTEWYYYDGATQAGGAWTEGAEFIFTVQVDEGDDTTGIDYRRYNTAWALQDSVLGENFALGTPTDCDGINIGDQSGAGTIDAYFRWIAFRKCIDTEPEFDSFGAEELYSEWDPIIWQEVGEAIFYFNVRFDSWGLSMILVFGGLVLMIVSVCMMAVKVRDRTITQDSGILFLFLFCVGWGLFIGGTLIG